jgi:hypothetical protein
MIFEQVIPGRRYVLRVPDHQVELFADRLEWTRNELHGELSLVAGTLGGRHYDGPVTAGSFNFSSTTTRDTRAKYFAKITKTTSGIDWAEIIEEMCRWTVNTHRSGPPSIDLRTATPPPPDDVRTIHGLGFSLRQPTMLYGDGGSLKSYLALWIAGTLSRQGLRPLLADWEMEAGDHLARLRGLFGDNMPYVEYLRCELPMSAMVDHLSRTIADKRIDYLIADSVGFACDGPPEQADVALRYGSAVRQLRIGSMHLAHVVKNREEADYGPFGSRFWFNLARRVYQVKREDVAGPAQRVSVITRKNNSGDPKAPPLAFAVDFSRGGVEIRPCEPAAHVPARASVPYRMRILNLLEESGPMTYASIARELHCATNTVVQTVTRNTGPGQDFELVENPSTHVTEVRIKRSDNTKTVVNFPAPADDVTRGSDTDDYATQVND